MNLRSKNKKNGKKNSFNSIYYNEYSLMWHTVFFYFASKYPSVCEEWPGLPSIGNPEKTLQIELLKSDE